MGEAVKIGAETMAAKVEVDGLATLLNIGDVYVQGDSQVVRDGEVDAG